MDTREFVLSLGLAGVLGVTGAAAGQHESHQLGAAATPSAAQVAECRQAQPVITGLLNAALKRLEDARLTNSAVAMRDAADDVQAALVDMRAQLAPCADMQVASADAAHTMPPTPQASPGGSPGKPGTPAGSPVAAPAGADPHAGHVPPAAPQTPVSRPSVAAPTDARATPPRAAAPAATDPHAGHAVPPATSPVATSAASATARTATASAPPTTIAELKCTNAVDQKTAPRMVYQGRMYYFCTEASRAEFAKDPAKFVTAPPQAAPAHAH